MHFSCVFKKKCFNLYLPAKTGASQSGILRPYAPVIWCQSIPEGTIPRIHQRCVPSEVLSDATTSLHTMKLDFQGEKG